MIQALLVPAASLLAGLLGAAGAAETPQLREAIALLGSAEPFEREKGEAILLGIGREALSELQRIAEAPGDALFRTRVERIFSEILDATLDDYEREEELLDAERRELAELLGRIEAAQLREALRPRFDAWKRKDPRAQEVLEDLLRLQRWEEREQAGAQADEEGSGAKPPADLDALRRLREETRAKVPDLDGILDGFRRIARLEASLSGPPTSAELARMRVRDLEASIRTREPRTADRLSRLEALGLAAWNGLLARRVLKGEPAGRHEPRILAAVEARKEELVPEDAERFEAVRYLRSSLWAWIADRPSEQSERASTALARHLEAVLADLRHPEPEVRRRAEVELYILGERGVRALREELAKVDLATSSADERTGIDFREYPSLEFRERRKRVFEFARAAGSEAVPTLRRIVSDRELEPSFAVRVAAAKALAGLRDLSGYEILLRERPELALSRPQVSLELGIVQGVRSIQEKQYQAAVEELKKVLAESPFDFRANYHIAFAYLLLKEYDKAIHHFEIAKRIQPDDQLTLYNLACAYALSGKKEEALRELRAAVEAGFDDVEHIESDPDLESLRGDPRYKDLVRTLRKRR